MSQQETLAAKLFVEPRNQEFIELMESAGWTQAEVARQLEITSGAVNQIVQGRVTPSPVTMRLLKMLVGGPEHRTRADPPASGVDWRARAVAAERKLQVLKAAFESVFNAAPTTNVDEASPAAHRLENLGGHRISVAETLPSIPPEERDGIRAGAMDAQRVVKAEMEERRARGLSAAGTAASTSGGKSGRAPRLPVDPYPRFEDAVPAPASPPHNPPGLKGSAGTPGSGSATGSKSSPAATPPPASVPGSALRGSVRRVSESPAKKVGPP